MDYLRECMRVWLVEYVTLDRMDNIKTMKRTEAGTKEDDVLTPQQQVSTVQEEKYKPTQAKVYLQLWRHMFRKYRGVKPSRDDDKFREVFQVLNTVLGVKDPESALAKLPRPTPKPKPKATAHGGSAKKSKPEPKSKTSQPKAATNGGRRTTGDNGVGDIVLSDDEIEMDDAWGDNEDNDVNDDNFRTPPRRQPSGHSRERNIVPALESVNLVTGRDYDIQNVPGDGKCFFHAVAMALNPIDGSGPEITVDHVYSDLKLELMQLYPEWSEQAIYGGIKYNPPMKRVAMQRDEAYDATKNGNSQLRGWAAVPEEHMTQEAVDEAFPGDPSTGNPFAGLEAFWKEWVQDSSAWATPTLVNRMAAVLFRRGICLVINAVDRANPLMFTSPTKAVINRAVTAVVWNAVHGCDQPEDGVQGNMVVTVHLPCFKRITHVLMLILEKDHYKVVRPKTAPADPQRPFLFNYRDMDVGNWVLARDKIREAFSDPDNIDWHLVPPGKEKK